MVSPRNAMQRYFISPGRLKKFCTDQTLWYTLEFWGKAEKSEFVLQTDERGRVESTFSRIRPCVCSCVVPTRVTCTFITFTCLHCNLLISRCNTPCFIIAGAYLYEKKDAFFHFLPIFFYTRFFFASCPDVCSPLSSAREYTQKRERKKRYMYKLSPHSLNYKDTKVLAQQRRGRNRQIMQKIEEMGFGGRENSLHLLAMLHKWEGGPYLAISLSRMTEALAIQVLALVTSQAT